jgi:hypothetical protein
LKRLLVLTVYPTFWAGTRLRAEQYRPYFEQQGFSTTLWTFLRDADMDRWFQGSYRDRLGIVAGGMLRILVVPVLITRSDVVLVLREILPFGPPVLERLAARMRPLIWDVDDAVWKSGRSHYLPWIPTWIRRSSGKFEQICRMAGQVWAATAVIAGWCAQFNGSVRVVPTVVDVPAERPSRVQKPVVGWIGAPSTRSFLESVLPAIAKVQPAPEVLVLGAEIGGHYGIPISAAPWSLAREAETLERISVGLYPIDRSHPLAEGKAALKTILYMSQGIPAVVTPTTTNALVVTDGVEGLHAETLEDWTDQVQRLLTDAELWEGCSVAAHSRALADFSLQRWGPEVAGHLSDVVKATPGE